jgi:integrase
MLWDTVTRGFGLRIGKQSKTFIVLIGEGRRQTIGRYPDWTLGKARDEAGRILAEKRLGNVKPTFKAYEEAKNEYLEDCKAKNRDSTYKGYKWRLEAILDFGRKNLADIKPRDVLAKLKTTKASQERRYAFVVARSFFNWCVANHHLDISPMARLTPPPKGSSRERVLTPDELRAVWNACPPDAYGNIVQLLILTGQRRGEIEHISLEGDLATIPSEYTKNHRTHTFPVGPMALERLQKPRKWGGWGKSKARLDKASGVANYSLHDLRRTFSTYHGEVKTPPHIVERIINHVTGTVSGVAAIYNRYQYIEEMREATKNYEAHLTKLLNRPASA